MCRNGNYRDNTGREVDLVLENTAGAVVAVEVKAAASPSGHQLRHLAWLRDRLDRAEPGAFKAGVLLHCGTHSHKLGDRLHSMTIDCLWSRPRASGGA